LSREDEAHALILRVGIGVIVEEGDADVDFDPLAAEGDTVKEAEVHGEKVTVSVVRGLDDSDAELDMVTVDVAVAVDLGPEAVIERENIELADGRVDAVPSALDKVGDSVDEPVWEGDTVISATDELGVALCEPPLREPEAHNVAITVMVGDAEDERVVIAVCD
jgi:hypothetical protein